MYTDEHGNEYKDVVEEVPVSIFPLYSWDKESEGYQLLPTPHPTTLAERMAHLFSEDLITEDKSIRLAYLWMIREWLYLNANCSQSVFIDRDLTIHSKSRIVLRSNAAKLIPDYIHSNNN